MSKVDPFHNNIKEVVELLTTSTNNRLNERNLLLFKIQVNYALRANELLKLTLSDLKRGYIMQSKTKKTKKLRYLPDLIIKASEYCEKYKIKDRPICLNIRKKPLSYRMWQHIYENIGKSLNLKLGTHSLRKTLARKAYEITKDIRFVMQLLGHSNIYTTLAYIGLTDEEFAENSRLIGEI